MKFIFNERCSYLYLYNYENISVLLSMWDFMLIEKAKSIYDRKTKNINFIKCEKIKRLIINNSNIKVTVLLLSYFLYVVFLFLIFAV